jgi:putative transposase
VSLHTYIANRVQIVFLVKHHRDLIPESLLPELWAVICGVCHNLGIKTYAVGGTCNHVHAFVGFPCTIALSTAVQKVKANSSRFLHQRAARDFA